MLRGWNEFTSPLKLSLSPPVTSEKARREDEFLFCLYHHILRPIPIHDTHAFKGIRFCTNIHTYKHASRLAFRLALVGWGHRHGVRGIVA